MNESAAKDREFVKAVLDDVSRVGDPSLSGVVSFIVGTLWVRGISAHGIREAFDDDVFDDGAQMIRAAEIFERQFPNVYDQRLEIDLKLPQIGDRFSIVSR